MSHNVSIFGLGYVGCVSAACLASDGHSVIGVDVSDAKVDRINAGQPTVIEKDIGEIVGEAVQSGRLSATTDAEEAVCRSSLSLICVGTPSQPNGSLDLTHIERVCTHIGRALRNKAASHTVTVRSTVLPGTTRGLVIPALEEASGKRAGRDFHVLVNPEFLREGSSVYDFHHPPFTIIGAEDAPAAAELAALYADLDAPLHVSDYGVAEMLKYACNCFHGVKVTFANEIGSLCKALGTDSHEVMRLFCQDTKLNISPRYLLPGFAFGGSCLGKDLRAAVYRARQLDVETPMLAAVLESNKKHVGKAFDMVLRTGRRRIGMLGLSFKAGTDDLRESPIVSLTEMLIGKGMDLAIYDGHVTRSGTVGANREYIEREIPHIWSLMRGSVREVVEDSDVVVIANSAPEFREIAPTLRQDQIVIDLVRALDTSTSDDGRYQGLCW